MKSIAMKLIALLLAALLLLTGIASVLGMIAVDELELDVPSVDGLWAEEYRSYAWGVAAFYAREYAYYAYSTAPQEVLVYALNQGLVYDMEYGFLPDVIPVGYTVTDSNGQVLKTAGSLEGADNRYLYRFENIRISYYHIHLTLNAYSHMSDYTENLTAFYYRRTDFERYQVLCDTPNPSNFTVELMLEIVPGQYDSQGHLFLARIANYLPAILAFSLLLFLLLVVYLCWAAGRNNDTAEIRPKGLNALPLDFYGLAIAVIGLMGAYALVFVVSEVNWTSVWPQILLAALLLYLGCLMVVAYIFALAAQFKAESRFWWRRSVIGFCCIRILRGLKWLYRAARAVLRLMPAMGQWLLVAAAMVVVPVLVLLVVGIVFHQQDLAVLMFLGSLVLDVALVIYGGWCFGTILSGARKMAAGDLKAQIDTQNLYGSFRDCADRLNAMSDTVQLAAQEQMKSERMKTELITNVSHDIKTPLTSIINFVDLLQKPHTDQQQEEYLQVLQRQSDRLKKLIEDLTELSKASSGSIIVQLGQLDAVEAVRQALGEFDDKLQNAGLTPVFNPPSEPLPIHADGRLTWRVLSNLLGNAVKYAMPGTRLYADLTRVDNKVLLSLKNVSAQPLNISAAELMERFVRGDAARNTEGSGLGLNIAQSLMEAQGGQLHLTVDGDLFKVTLFFECS